MDTLLSEQMRLFILVVSCGVLLSLESILPLYSYGHNRLRRTMPNVALTALFVLTNLLLSFATANVASFGANQRFGLFFLLAMPTWLELLLGIAALDLFAYCAHVLLHRSWVGWQFHRVHHSDGEVNVTTAFRQHPGETFWRVLWKVLAVALFGIPLWIVVIYLTISAMNAQLEHSNIRLNKSLDTLIRLVFVTPNMHKIHHSREQQQTDTNYSNIFSFWDRIFGTYTSLVDFSRLRYGLNGFDDPTKQTLTALLKNPFSVEGSVKEQSTFPSVTIK